jgi:Holliday junction resolvasome RuvABC endonuclease subunit
MKIPVVGFDPSLRSWGVAQATLDLQTGYLTDLVLSIIEPKEPQGKQVRKNSHDLYRAEQLAKEAFRCARLAKVIFVEVPVGSQSARAMASYGICVGILGSIMSEGIPLIEVTATEVKKSFTGDKNATKDEMIAYAVSTYPTANFPRHRGKVSNKAEHVADAIATIHAGVNTPMFQNLMRLFAGV